MKITHRLFRVYSHIGDDILHSYMGMKINHEIRILIKQPVFHDIFMESKVVFVFFVAHLFFFGGGKGWRLVGSVLLMVRSKSGCTS